MIDEKINVTNAIRSLENKIKESDQKVSRCPVIHTL